MDWISLLFHLRSMVPAGQESNSYWFVLHTVTRFFWSLRSETGAISLVQFPHHREISHPRFAKMWSITTLDSCRLITQFLECCCSSDFLSCSKRAHRDLSSLITNCWKICYRSYRLVEKLEQTSSLFFCKYFAVCIFCKYFAVWVERQQERNT